MNKLVLLLLVAFLVGSTGGILNLVVPEACSPAESASSPADGNCSPTCVRCHCAHAFDLALDLAVAAVAPFTPEPLPPSTAVPQPVPHDILHVPKPVLA